jgi:hypothetical protein
MQFRQPPQAQIRLSGYVTSSTPGRCLRRELRLVARSLAIQFPAGKFRLVLGMYGSHSRFQVFQCQIELFEIGLLERPKASP